MEPERLVNVAHEARWDRPNPGADTLGRDGPDLFDLRLRRFG